MYTPGRKPQGTKSGGAVALVRRAVPHLQVWKIKSLLRIGQYRPPSDHRCRQFAASRVPVIKAALNWIKGDKEAGGLGYVVTFP